jgi:retron-type reverse transcriptase
MKPFLLNAIAKDFMLSESEALNLILSSPRRYKTYQIPKRTQGQYRTIAQPAKEVKFLQYWMIENILNKLPIHPAASAYVRGKSIKDNANIHVNSEYLLKIDFRDFFPSIKPNDFLQYINMMPDKILTGIDVDYAIRILFWRPRFENILQLAIGAPSSPLLSNILMFNFDKEVSEICMTFMSHYSRYADDLTFSANDPDTLRKIYGSIEKICHKMKSPSLVINTDKTIFTSKKHRRRVTGLILSNEGKVSLGRERKRSISAKIHHYTLGDFSKADILKLKGLLAFAMDVEPSFIERMRRKYTTKTIDDIFKTS